MSEFRLPAYRLPVDPSGSINECVNVLVSESQGNFEPQSHPPHLTLLRQSLFGGRVGIDVATLHIALQGKIDSEPESYSLLVRGIENTTRNLSKTAILAIILEDVSGKYNEEYSSIRSKMPERIRGKADTNTPHITLGRLEPSSMTEELLSVAEEVLPSQFTFGPLQFSAAIKKHHGRYKSDDVQQ